MNLVERIDSAADLIAQQGGTPSEVRVHPSVRKDFDPNSITLKLTARGRPETFVRTGRWNLKLVVDDRYDAAYVFTPTGTRRPA